jgi:hypothetical protein
MLLLNDNITRKRRPRMASINQALQELKRNPLQAVPTEWVDEACLEFGHHWRARELPPAATIGLFIQQVIQGNACCQAVRHIGKKAFTASAWCQARGRLPLAVYRKLVRRAYESASRQDRSAGHLWLGHRTFLVDGTGVTLWDSPKLRETFGLPGGVKEGCGFPVCHLLTLFNAHNGLLVDAAAAGVHRGDLADLPALLEHLQAGDVLVGDDSFGCYVVLALLGEQKAHGLFPVRESRTVDFTPHRPFSREGQRHCQPGIAHSRWIASLGHRDQLVEYFKPCHRPTWIAPELWKKLPAGIVVRELRRNVRHPVCGVRELTMVTTLVDKTRYPARALTELRGARWQVEIDIRHLKTTLKMDMLHCRTPEGVRKELCIFALAYNLVRSVILAAARRQKVPPNRISFTDALHWLQFARPEEPLRRLHVNPVRLHRVEPRVQKRRDKEFPYMTRPREEYKKNLSRQKNAA